MDSMTIVVSDEHAGWFVVCEDRFGPFFSRQGAMDLANGMASAIRSSGMSVELCLPVEAPGPYPHWLRP